MRVLIVDDNQDTCSLFSKVAVDEGHESTQAPNGADAWREYKASPYDLVFCDYHLPDVSGMDLLKRIRGENHETAVVIMTEHGSEELAVQALRHGASNYLKKPVPVADVRSMLRKYDETIQERVRFGEIQSRIRTHRMTLTCPTRLDLVPALSHFLVDRSCFALPDSERFNLRLGLHELLMNAIEHGNLEISGREKAKALEQGAGALTRLYEERMANPEYGGRQITVSFDMNLDEVEWVIVDEGPGFDWEEMMDSEYTPNPEAYQGRGIFLARFQFHRIEYRGRGNEVRVMRLLDGEDAWDVPDGM